MIPTGESANMKVAIKNSDFLWVKTKYGGIYLDTHTFDSIDVNGCRDVYEFTIPSSSQPYNIEVLTFEWDFSCTFAHMNPGFLQ